MKIFDLDSPVIRFLGKLADLMWLNILTIICCIPIITAGAAITSLHYVCLKLVRDEESYITPAYFRAFKQNFLQSTGIWLIYLLIMLVLGGDIYMFLKKIVDLPNIVQIVVGVVTLLVLFSLMWVFPLQSKFYNPIKQTFKNAFALSLANLPKSVCMVIIYVIPAVAAIYYYEIWPVIMVLGISLPSYLAAVLYNSVFKKIEDQMEAAVEKPANPDDDDKIFHDELVIPEE